MQWIEEYNNVYMRKVIDLRRQGRIPREYGFSTPECHAIVMQVCEKDLVWRKNEKGEEEFLLAKFDDLDTGLIVYAGRHGVHDKWVEEDRKIESECLRQMIGKQGAWLEEKREVKAADANVLRKRKKKRVMETEYGEMMGLWIERFLAERFGETWVRV